MRKETRWLLTAVLCLTVLFCAAQTAFADGPDLSGGNMITLLASQAEYGPDFIRAGLQADFEKDFLVKGRDGKKGILHLAFYYVGDRSYNIAYVLRTTLMDEA